MIPPNLQRRSDSICLTIITVGSFTVKTNSWNPNPAYVGQIISGQVQGKFDPSSIDGGGSGPTFVIYNWSTAGVWYSQDGTAGTFEPCGSYAVGWQQGQADTTFRAQFFAPGQYLLEVSCVATVYSQSTGAVVASFSGTGYIGGSASDIDTSGGSAGQAHTAQGLKAHAGGGDGISILPATVTFDKTSLKLGLGSVLHHSEYIGATVTPFDQVGSVGFTALNNLGLESNEVNVSIANQNPATGQVLLLVTALSPTPASTGGSPDCTIVATVPAFAVPETVASATALVLVPMYCNEVDPPDPQEDNEHYVFPDQPPKELGGPLNPTLFNSTKNLAFVTTEDTTVNITIYDQFHIPLDSIYDGFGFVQESLTGSVGTNGFVTMVDYGQLSSGVIQDEVRVTKDDVPVDPTPYAKDAWKWNGYNLRITDNDYDNAIAIASPLIDKRQITITQTLAISGYVLSPAWTRAYTLYSRNHPDGPPMGPVTETPVH